MNTKDFIALTESYSAHNYAPLEVVAQYAEGAWVTDVDGKKYLDFLSAYSATNFGHRNPRLIKAAKDQLDQITLISRAFYTDQTAYLGKELSELTGKGKALLMNSGAEAVETAIKCARKWGNEVKGIEDGATEIICFTGNFHGRTTGIISFSTADSSKKGFGPFVPGFIVVPYGDIEAVKKAITPRTCGVLIEPIQGEGGIIIPPAGFLQELRALCSANQMLMIADEIQTGFCRTGKLFACDHENVTPDVYIVAKSLGGGIVPISAILADDDVMSVFTPGVHGSTFGGNPFACAIAREVVALIRDEKPHDRALELGRILEDELKKISSPAIEAIRVRGLMCGVDIKPEFGPAKDFCKKLKYEGLLCKDTRQQTIRFLPPLTISESDLRLGIAKIKGVFEAV
jgi:ornithine--oxo-acid transaminase